MDWMAEILDFQPPSCVIVESYLTPLLINILIGKMCLTTTSYEIIWMYDANRRAAMPTEEQPPLVLHVY